MPAQLFERSHIESLRRKHYNATATHIHRVHDELMILRVQLDEGRLDFAPGQYTVLGLGYWEPRVPGCQEEQLDEKHLQSLVRRAYSISCPLLDDNGQLFRANQGPFVEFYVTLVRSSALHPPALTPRLFALTEGDRLFLSTHVHGHYTLEDVRPEDTVIFAATGTGEAPHNAMLVELLASGHRGRIASLNCVRNHRDLAYLPKHRELERRFSNYRYVALTTREPENLDPAFPGYIGKRYLQDFFSAESFERESGCRLDPRNTHVFLCGNPEMIGVPHHTHDPAKRYPQPRGMVEVLERRGFQVDQPHEPGNVHFEKYW